jgi:phytoene dehydrogenase-like protein
MISSGKRSQRAVVVGSGPNGLASAIVLAQAGMEVEVFEAQPQPGGATRTMELTLPDFHHDFGSAVHPLAAGSPFFTNLPLHDHGLEWIHFPAPIAHPLDDGTAVVLERDLGDATRALGEDGRAWDRLLRPLVERWTEIAPDLLGPVLHIPRHPLVLARFGISAVRSAQPLANRHFCSTRTKALFAGLAAHSMLALDEPLTGAFGVMLAVSAHAVGWPIPRRGSQSIANALIAHLRGLGGTVTTSTPVHSLHDLGDFKLALCDITPKQLLQIAGERFSQEYKQSLARYRYGPGAFKVDYALSGPIPWKAADCARAATVHVGGTLEEIARSEREVRDGVAPERPFLLVVQPTLADPTRAPQGKHIAWVYCHVPNGSSVDMLPRIEAQLERFAPGFRDCVLARNILRPADLERLDANLIGGDIGGGEASWRQFVFRPTRHLYATSAKDVYICSSSTPPGGGVHGMCGYHAATLALKHLRI